MQFKLFHYANHFFVITFLHWYMFSHYEDLTLSFNLFLKFKHFRVSRILCSINSEFFCFKTLQEINTIVLTTYWPLDLTCIQKFNKVCFTC
jgi:hypothetical protein